MKYEMIIKGIIELENVDEMILNILQKGIDDEEDETILNILQKGTDDEEDVEAALLEMAENAEGVKVFLIPYIE